MCKVNKPFWETKTLTEMTREEWESLCDGCGRCCLVKLQDDNTDEVFYTLASCALLDIHSCKCKNYKKRMELVHDCVELAPENIDDIEWLPLTCAYRKIAEGRPLSWWHPLVSGSSETVHEAGISVRGKTVSETYVCQDDLWGMRISWPQAGEE
ncbi:MAG: YcgN family cysteine cluster protein [Hyphomicrobiales bacterium]